MSPLLPKLRHPDGCGGRPAGVASASVLVARLAWQVQDVDLSALDRQQLERAVVMLASLVDLGRTIGDIIAEQTALNVRDCQRCRRPFLTDNPNRRYCTPPCRVEARRESWRASKQRRREAA